MPFPPRSPPQGLPVRSRLLPGWTEPAVAFDLLYATAGYAIWLDAGEGATTGVSYLAAAHSGSEFVSASTRAGTVTRSRPLAGGDVPVTTPGTVFNVLRAELPATPAAGIDPDPDPDSDAGFRLGWVGWLGYNAATPVTGVPTAPGAGVDAAPDAAFLFVDRAIAFDHAARTVTLLMVEKTGGDVPVEPDANLDAWALRTSRLLAAAPLAPAPLAPAPLRPGAPAGAATTVSPSAVYWRHDPDGYARLIAACQDRIAAGDAYQLCLTNEVTIAGRFIPAEVYRRLRAGSPSHHGGLLRFGQHALLSASPEEFLSVSPAGRLRTRPIKGTRPRSTDPVGDRMLSAELVASDKERAENLMIVDLMRNDLGRVAALGSVAVTALLQVESYPHVHQLVSTIEADLAPGLGAVDAIEACFPAGSMTGAPKVSAMTILRTLEAGERGVYAGAFGYLGLDGAVDLAMVIRSIVLGPNGASIGTGGGITALSVAAEEIEETRIKARALIDAVLASSAGPAR